MGSDPKVRSFDEVSSHNKIKDCWLIINGLFLSERLESIYALTCKSQTKYQIVLTKTDLVFPATVARRAMQNEESLKASKSVIQPLMMVSSSTGAGIRILRTRFMKC